MRYASSATDVILATSPVGSITEKRQDLEKAPKRPIAFRNRTKRTLDALTSASTVVKDGRLDKDVSKAPSPVTLGLVL